MSLELRALKNKTEVRIGEGDATFIDGYAAVFDQPTIIWDFEEVIAPGAFKRALSEKQDVRALFNHDANYPLARSTIGTLVLREDKNGLWTEARISKNPTSDSVVDYVRTGLVSGMSFAFTVRKNEWQFQEPGNGSLDRRVITEIGVLYDVGPVTYPAYEQTSVKIRADAKKLHDEARSRWENARSARSSVSVPLKYGDSFAELRSGDAWVRDAVEPEVQPEAGMKDAEEIKEPEKTGEEAKPTETPAPVVETPKAEVDETLAAGRSADATPAEVASSGELAETEAISREVRLKEARGRVSHATRSHLRGV